MQCRSAADRRPQTQRGQHRPASGDRPPNPLSAPLPSDRPADAPEQQQDGQGQQGQQLPLYGAIPDLPLWRVQWAVLPGMQAILHVHVPHYCLMFEGLFRAGRPWRFGHLYLPGGRLKARLALQLPARPLPAAERCAPSPSASSSLPSCGPALCFRRLQEPG
jgi:hypothetical protein